MNTRPLYEEVAERLRTQIFAHDFPPGSWLDEQSLAEQYGISRTPMREAIKVLAAEGLITMKLRRGAYVTEVNQADLAQIFTVLSLLESEAAKTAALHASESELNRLDDLHLKLEKAAADRDLEQFFEINVRFHDLLLEITGNPWMTGVIADLRKVLKLQRRNSLDQTGRLQNSLLEHRGILKAILQRDGELAAKAMREHLAQGLVASRWIYSPCLKMPRLQAYFLTTKGPGKEAKYAARLRICLSVNPLAWEPITAFLRP